MSLWYFLGLTYLVVNMMLFDARRGGGLFFLIFLFCGSARKKGLLFFAHLSQKPIWTKP